MPRDEDFRSRRRRLEKEQAEKPNPDSLDEAAVTQRLEELLARATPLVEQVNGMYARYLQGIEKFAPVERRTHLDTLMNTIFSLPKPTASGRFRAEALHQTYRQYRDKWDRQMRDLEAGRIKRRGR
jgi:hypothetical protein